MGQRYSSKERDGKQPFFLDRKGWLLLSGKDDFAALFSFHQVLKAPGTVLIAHVVEHKQQSSGRVWETNILLQGPSPLWCQLCHMHSVNKSLFQPNDD